jgi:hypothetical protein
MEYEVKKGHYAQIEGEGLKNIMNETLGKVTESDGKLVSSYGAITKLEVTVKGKNAIEVVSVTNKEAPLDVQADTIKHWNMFLEAVTGFTSKERSKRLQKKAKEGKL